ncbi:beta family protein [Chryseobacterium sp. 8AT]|uniref:beta family protein n=1 Tax=Chryseobacterium sp. 8AT TaxID=2653134 RepID=UPI0012F1C685|nr:beta family protein [Chryseobacterium sp. 8AT]VXB02189.1 conserved hypothetical protein [Chryseobacterium sp. 8AT]
MNNKIYMPILKGKKGEFDALKTLEHDVKSLILPLIEVPSIPWDYVNDRENSTIEKQIVSTVKSITTVWNDNYEILVDTKNLDERFDGNKATINTLMEGLIEEKFKPIPVIHINTSSDLLEELVYQENICIRVNFEDQEDFDINEEIARITETIGCDLSKVILLLDMNYLLPQNIHMAQVSSKALINSINNLEQFKDFYFASTSFPMNLSSCKTNSTTQIDRIEVVLNKYFIQQAEKLIRIPKFSDYVISNPDIEEMDPRLMTIGASIRYTTENSWYIFKGASIKKHGSEQYYELSRNIANSGIFSGENFSWGDKQINNKANDIGGPGNSTTWRQIGTNHHITFVVNQISN